MPNTRANSHEIPRPTHTNFPVTVATPPAPT
jgi:hypothetical protein